MNKRERGLGKKILKEMKETGKKTGWNVSVEEVEEVEEKEEDDIARETKEKIKRSEKKDKNNNNKNMKKGKGEKMSNKEIADREIDKDSMSKEEQDEILEARKKEAEEGKGEEKEEGEKGEKGEKEPAKIEAELIREEKLFASEGGNYTFSKYEKQLGELEMEIDLRKDAKKYFSEEISRLYAGELGISWIKQNAEKYSELNEFDTPKGKEKLKQLEPARILEYLQGHQDEYEKWLAKEEKGRRSAKKEEKELIKNKKWYKELGYLSNALDNYEEYSSPMIKEWTYKRLSDICNEKYKIYAEEEEIDEMEAKDMVKAEEKDPELKLINDIRRKLWGKLEIGNLDMKTMVEAGIWTEGMEEHYKAGGKKLCKEKYVDSKIEDFSIEERNEFFQKEWDRLSPVKQEVAGSINDYAESRVDSLKETLNKNLKGLKEIEEGDILALLKQGASIEKIKKMKAKWKILPERFAARKIKIEGERGTITTEMLEKFIENGNTIINEEINGEKTKLEEEWDKKFEEKNIELVNKTGSDLSEKIISKHYETAQDVVKTRLFKRVEEASKIGEKEMKEFEKKGLDPLSEIDKMAEVAKKPGGLKKKEEEFREMLGDYGYDLTEEDFEKRIEEFKQQGYDYEKFSEKGFIGVLEWFWKFVFSFIKEEK